MHLQGNPTYIFSLYFKKRNSVVVRIVFINYIVPLSAVSNQYPKISIRFPSFEI